MTKKLPSKDRGISLKCNKQECKNEWDYKTEDEKQPPKYTSCPKSKSHVNVAIQTIGTWEKIRHFGS